MAEPVDSAIMYKDNEVAQPDSTCNKTLRAEGKGYPRTCRKCGKGPCIADRVQPEQEQWDPIPDAFNEWWDADYDDTGNPYRKDSPAYWAWSGWKAASKQPDAYGYAKRLAVAIWEQHYKATAPQWKPLDDLIGVLTQIDNMTAGLTAPPAAQRQRVVFPTMLRKMWSGGEVQAWLDENVNKGNT
jgi:hypothetical protein